MECNRDEATRAKEIAERKFKAKDVAAARKFASKAQSLNPELDGISQMLATFEVYLASENKISGETDWYAILGVNATADDDTVKKQYRKLALMLHPDKNKSVGAEGAFKLLSEAWSVLSDKSRRLSYDQKRNTKGSHQEVQQTRDSSAPNANGFYNFPKTTSNTKPPKAASRTTAPTSVPTSSRPSKTNTFWTACNQCKMQYEYLRVYLNHNLLCPNCHKPFLAVETGSPANGSNSSVTFSFPQQQRQHNTSKNAHVQGRNTSAAPNAGTVGYTHGAGIDSFNQANFQWSPFSRTAGVASAAASSSAAAQAANVVHRTYEKVRREREEAQAATRREEAMRRKNSTSKRASSGSSMGNSNAASSSNALDRERAAPKAERPAKKRRGMDDDGVDEVEETGFKGQTTSRHINANTGVPESERVNDQVLTRNLLIEKARTMIRNKLAEWDAAATAKAVVNEREKEKEAASVPNTDVSDQNKADEPVNEKKQVSINVPDPDFHDFDKDRTERSFDANQVWAAYDDDDGMPRFYALIQKVISLKPFKMRFSWLNSKTNGELGPINWVASGFTKTCGEFRVGRYEVNDTVNVFSHRVRWEKGVRGVVRVVPQTGDVWALYRNWSPNWNERTPDNVVHKYDMVEVLDGYNEEHGVSVTPLVKVAGFKTVFHRHMDPAQVRRIPREETFRFSHQVPSWLLTGEEAANAPKGCRELDPAATPLELLQVITETTEDKMADTAELMQESKDKTMMETAEKIHETKQHEAVGIMEQIQTTKKDVETVDKRQQGEKNGRQRYLKSMRPDTGSVMLTFKGPVGAFDAWIQQLEAGIGLQSLLISRVLIQMCRYSIHPIY
ncbi:hypothetical protein AAC387_Pa01g2036 [Persea americana]